MCLQWVRWLLPGAVLRLVVLMPVLAVAVGVGAGGGAQQGRSGQGKEQQALPQVWGAGEHCRSGGVRVPHLRV